LYERAYKLLMNPINTVTVPIYGIGMPALSRLGDDAERYRRAYISLSERLAMLTVPTSALMIVTSDWIVSLLLGAQWRDAAPIVAWLGLAAALLPVGVTTGLLFLSQGRTAELFQVGALCAAISIVAILIGLPFGPVGVAAAFALGNTFVRLPTCIWLAGRRGPVTATDIFASTVPAVIAACASVAAVLAFRSLPPVAAASPFVGLLLCACTAVVVALLVFCLIPRSRRAILTLKHLHWHFFNYRKAEAQDFLGTQ
jgi:polysaccharide transporter, PST family